MDGRRPFRTAARFLVGAAVLGVLGACQPAPMSLPSGVPTGARSAPAVSEPRDAPREHAPRMFGESGNAPDGLTVFDTRTPAVTKLDPDLRAALRRAAADAARVGITVEVNSGWRSAEYQARMLSGAVDEYGSEAEAARWVATPETSPHVSGDAVDLGPTTATTWLSRYGARYGLCQIYDNEPWHFELRPAAVDQGCPPRYADPTQDPRMR